jgi:hypothetical protein
MAMKSKLTARLGALAAAVTLIACTDTPGPVDPEGAYLSGAATQEQLAAAFPRVSAQIMSFPGTVFADYDEAIGKLVFGVENANAAGGVERALRARGLAPANYQVLITEPIQQLATLREQWRPTKGGIQIHFSRYLCTLGFNATHVASGERSFITASHCTEKQGGVEGTEYFQPSQPVDPTVVAVEVADPPYLGGGPDCPKGARCRYSDAARALYSSGVNSEQGYTKKTTGVNTGSVEVDGDFTIASQDNTTTEFTVGTILHKVGRTSGWTSGQVSRTCVNTNGRGNIHLFCQTFVEADSDGGDSGSPVFEVSSGDDVTLVGILWGGSRPHPLRAQIFVMSPLSQIQQELGALEATAEP